MLPLMFAAVAASMIHFTLSSGAKVEMWYEPKETSEDEAIRAGISMATFIWKDFCGPVPKQRCDTGEYYEIHVGLVVVREIGGESYKTCDGYISYRRRDYYGETKPAHFEQFGNYNCYNSATDQDPRIFRDDTDVPQISTGRPAE